MDALRSLTFLTWCCGLVWTCWCLACEPPYAMVEPRLASKRGGRQMMGLEDRRIRKPAGGSLPTTATQRKRNTVRTKNYRLTAVVRRMQFELLNPVPSLSGTLKLSSAQ